MQLYPIYLFLVTFIALCNLYPSPIAPIHANLTHLDQVILRIVSAHFHVLQSEADTSACLTFSNSSNYNFTDCTQYCHSVWILQAANPKWNLTCTFQGPFTREENLIINTWDNTVKNDLHQQTGYFVENLYQLYREKTASVHQENSNFGFTGKYPILWAGNSTGVIELGVSYVFDD